MIIKAEIKRKPIQGLDTVAKKPVPKDKRYLICVNPDDESKSGYVYDLREQRIVYTITAKKDKSIEEVFDNIYSSFKRTDTAIVDHTIILNAIKAIPEPKKKDNLFTASLKLQEESKIGNRVPMLESIHIRKIKETYKYIDKYKVKMSIEVKKVGEDKAEIHLFDTLNGIDKGIHILKYDYYKGIYEYYYGPRLIVSSSELEDIFK